MKQKSKACLLGLAVTFLITGCSLPAQASNKADKEETSSVNAKPKNTDQLVDDRNVYNSYNNNPSVIDLYVTVLNDGSSTSNFYSINHWYDNVSTRNITPPPAIDAIVQEGSPNGPQPGDWEYGTNTANSTIAIRGNTSRLVQQKSYKISLSQNAGLWHGQTTLDLNKHEMDITRVRQKLSFDLFEDIPDMTSLRTQFVHLHVKDETANQPDKQFQDYGLYTQVEQPNKHFLYDHGLDPNANLYKANLFEFFRYPDRLKLATDPSFNKNQFESVLKIKRGSDHTHLLKMLDAVNNYNLNINDVIKQYFNRDNFLTWLAANLLMGNMDTESSNFYLYNPINSDKFYFLPWDYDAAWGQQNEEAQEVKGYTPKWEQGVSNYWGDVLEQRFFKDPKNIQDLSKKVEAVSKILNKQKIKSLLDSYYPVVSPFVHRYPDLQGLPFNIQDYDRDYQSILNVVDQNKKIYYQSIQNPMPVYLNGPNFENGSYQFSWDPSYSLQGNSITYDFQVSQSIDFSSVYINQKDLTGTSFKVNPSQLRPGINYWRVIIKDSKGNTQEAFDRIEGDDHGWYNGEMKFQIKQ